MITIHRNTDQNTYRSMAYGLVDPMTAKWCSDRVDEFRSTVNPEAQKYYDTVAGTAFDRIAYNDLHNGLLIAQRKSDSIWGEDVIRIVSDIGQLQNLPTIMLDYVMACPEISEYYDKQLIAGYDERYVDKFPTRRGEDNPIYRSVMDGVFVPVGDGEEEISTQWLCDDEAEEFKLDLYDQTAILENWRLVTAHILEGGEDPTSANNTML